MKTKKSLRVLTNYFAVLDAFGGTPPICSTYEQAVKKAEKKGFTFSQELWQEACQNFEQP